MQVGDLVRHHRSRAFGTIVDIRKNPWDIVETLALVYWMESDEQVLHPVGMLEAVCK